MSVSPGTRLGPYEVIAQIGVGGMGEVSRDGQRFLALQSVEPEQPPTQIKLVLNWYEELKRLVPSK